MPSRSTSTTVARRPGETRHGGKARGISSVRLCLPEGKPVEGNRSERRAFTSCEGVFPGLSLFLAEPPGRIVSPGGEKGMKQIPSNPSKAGPVPQAGRAESAKPPRQSARESGLARISAMINGSPGVRSLSQLKHALQHPAQKQDQEQSRVVATHDGAQEDVSPEAVVQCLMTGKAFAGQYKDAGTAGTGTKIAKLLTEYESAWGWGYGLPFTSEYDGKKY